MSDEIINNLNRNKSYVISTNGKLPALDASQLINLPESTIILSTEKERIELSQPKNCLYFVQQTKKIYYYSNNEWNSITGKSTGDSTGTIQVYVSNSNVITANVKVSSNANNIISIKSDGIYAKQTSHSNLATKSELNDYTLKEFRTGSSQVYKVLSDNNFTDAYKNLLDNPSLIADVATTQTAGIIKVGAGLVITQDGTLSVAGADPTSMVYSVNGKTGTITLTKSDIDLSNVDNTSDANKPISIAAQAALDEKIQIITYDQTNHKLQYKKTSEGNNADITLNGFISGISYDSVNSRLVINKTGHNDEYVNVTNKSLSSGSYDENTNSLILTMSDNSTISIALPSITNSYTVSDTSTIDLNKDVYNNITASVKIHSNNELKSDTNGLYIDLSNYFNKDYITQNLVPYSEYNETKHIHSNKSVLDKFNEDANNHLTYNGNSFESISVFETENIFNDEQSSSSQIVLAGNNIFNINHNLGSDNIISCMIICNFENNTSKKYQLGFLIIDENNIKIKIPNSILELNGNLKLKITASV